jgi:hypothetical protein
VAGSLREDAALTDVVEEEMKDRPSLAMVSAK